MRKQTILGTTLQPNRDLPTGWTSSVQRFLRALARFMRSNPIGALGVVIIAILVVVAVFASAIAPYRPTDQSFSRLLPPSADHVMGTDSIGRDTASRIIFGTRVSLYVGLIAVSISLVLGTTLGVIGGYFGGQTDALIMRLVDMMFAFPGLVFALLIAGLLGAGLTNTMIAVGITYTPTYARVARGALLSVISQPYVEAARAAGGNDLHIIRRHVLPNMMVPLIVMSTLSLSTAILAESSLSFLGLGVQPPDPSWGEMLSSNRQYMELAPSVAIFPGLAIMIAVLGFNFLGDGLRDALDPRLTER